jgi:hypothetical protein
MIKTSIVTSFPTIPAMGPVTRLTLRQAVKSAPVQRVYARAIAEPPMSAKRPPMAKMTPKQRRWVSANIDLPHQRTGGLVDKWKLLVIDAGDGARVVLSNSALGAKYALGDMRGRHQQQFMKDNQWTPAVEVRRVTFAAILDQMRRDFTPNLRDAMRVDGRRI